MSSKRSSQMCLRHERLGEALGREELRVHADHHDLLVVGAVEDADPAALRARGVGPPEEVVVELLASSAALKEYTSQPWG